MTGVEWGVIAVGVLGGTSGVAALLNAIFSKNKNRADAGKSTAEAATVVSNTAMEWIKKFEDAAEKAQAHAAKAQEQADRATEQAELARTQMQAVTREARAVAQMLAELRIAIMRPDATVEGLRALISTDPFNAHPTEGH